VLVKHPQCLGVMTDDMYEPLAMTDFRLSPTGPAQSKAEPGTTATLTLNGRVEKPIAWHCWRIGLCGAGPAPPELIKAMATMSVAVDGQHPVVDRAQWASVEALNGPAWNFHPGEPTRVQGAARIPRGVRCLTRPSGILNAPAGPEGAFYV